MSKKEKVTLCLSRDSMESMKQEAEEKKIDISELYQQAIDDFIGARWERDQEEQLIASESIPLKGGENKE
ncbi:MAG: hypothetical protein OXC18_02920 [Desulfurellaceae bacterium]|nr:hypothetical protein [Desulfurellaceae bacterium]